MPKLFDLTPGQFLQKMNLKVSKNMAIPAFSVLAAAIRASKFIEEFNPKLVKPNVIEWRDEKGNMQYRYIGLIGPTCYAWGEKTKFTPTPVEYRRVLHMHDADTIKLNADRKVIISKTTNREQWNDDLATNRAMFKKLPIMIQGHETWDKYSLTCAWLRGSLCFSVFKQHNDAIIRIIEEQLEARALPVSE